MGKAHERHRWLSLKERVDRAVRAYTDLKQSVEPDQVMPLLEYHAERGIVIVGLVGDMGPGSAPLIVSTVIAGLRAEHGRPLAVVHCAEAYVRRYPTGVTPLMRAGQLTEMYERGDPTVRECLAWVGVDRLGTMGVQREFHHEEGKLVLDEPTTTEVEGPLAEAMIAGVRGG